MHRAAQILHKTECIGNVCGYKPIFCFFTQVVEMFWLVIDIIFSILVFVPSASPNFPMLPIPKLSYTIFCKPVEFSELTSLINYWSSLPHQTTKYLKYLVKFGLLALAGRAGQQTTTPSTQPDISPVVTPAVRSCCHTIAQVSHAKLCSV